MANRLCRVVGKVPDYAVVMVKVPAATTMYAGDVIAVSALDSGIANNYQVFVGTKPATANLGDRMAIIINDGFEQMTDGRRVEGNPDYTQYSYGAGEVVTAVFLLEGLTFEISDDCVTPISQTAIVVGDFFEPVDGAYKASVIAKATGRTSGVTSALKVIALKDFRTGGNFGGGFISTSVARVTL